jgi:protein-S-isoprenylcysteine O-methyltransferase Ste14
MIAWINFGLMLVFITAFFFLYNRSVSPAALEEKMGDAAYTHCGRVRVISIIFLVLVLGNYLVYDFYPLPIPFLEGFSWSYPVSIAAALIIAIPTTYMVLIGMKDAGEEAIQPSKESEMFGGIYDRIRHPQTWEYGYFFALGFLLSNPFLVFFSFIWLPLMYFMMRAEEKDLLLRYGEEYQEYMNRTGRLLPRLRK